MSEAETSVDELLADYKQRVFLQSNRLFCILLVVQWIVSILFAAMVSPYAWEGTASYLHPHLVAAVGLGGALCILPLFLIWRLPGHALTRQTVAIAQLGFSSLLIHLTGGRIETHFHVFGSLAFLACYRDWRVFPTATAVVALDHLLRGLWFPESVYGVAYATPWRTLEHAGWVIFEDLVLIWSCRVSQREMKEICERQFQNQVLLAEMEHRVQIRTSELAQLNDQLVVASREAGMAEVATGVLHNVGNVLNSMNTSAAVVRDRLQKSRLIHLRKSMELIRSQRENLPGFFADDPKGKALPGFLEKLTSHLEEENALLRTEMEALSHHVDHIKQIISMQQSYGRVFGVLETLDPRALVDDAIRLHAHSFERHGIRIEREFADSRPVTADRHKVLQILVNLLRNAKQSIGEADPADRRITIALENQEDRVVIRVTDTGVGIPAENLNRIFRHGFTTKKNGHGFGLHSSVLAAREMKGDLKVHSDGPNTGATFSLELPTSREA